MKTKQERLDIANQILVHISQYGRQFFLHEGRVTHFDLDHRGRLWLVDGYTQKRIYLAYKYWKHGFSEGGTLRSLIVNLSEFIRWAEPIRNHFGPFPKYLCDGDLWGYGHEPMARLRSHLRHLVPSIPPELAAAQPDALEGKNG